MINEYVIMLSSQCNENGDNVEGVRTCTLTLTLWMNEWMKLKNVNEKESFGVNSLREFRWSVYTQPYYSQELLR